MAKRDFQLGEFKTNFHLQTDARGDLEKGWFLVRLHAEIFEYIEAKSIISKRITFSTLKPV
ncbi:hypothetical protein [Lactococcus cremoris]|uniref:hypothetical protein n=1 Tax=Lactococcus lactis subsp. cremoris TaxID=1359 RepID=UPI000582E0F9|nr:hypothetical protein [Lactococcus cremoris]KGH33490.1 hypothetical protein JL36_06455 [Lactococcus cremoris]